MTDFLVEINDSYKSVYFFCMNFYTNVIDTSKRWTVTEKTVPGCWRWGGQCPEWVSLNESWLHWETAEPLREEHHPLPLS